MIKMERVEYEAKAAEIADIMIEGYKDSRFSPNFTLWGVAFRWNGGVIDGEKRDNPFYAFIPNTFELIEDPVKPSFLIPRARSVPMHYSMLCLANRDGVEAVYRDALEDAEYGSIEDIMEIVSDRRLADEAVQRFVDMKKSGKLGDDVDLVAFLLHYSSKKSEMKEDKKKPTGSFAQLATRLVHRYGEKGFEEGIFSLVEPDIAEEGRRLHYEISPRASDLSIDGTVQSLYEKHVAHNGTSPIPEEEVPKVTGVGLEGKRKVVFHGGKGNIRWAALEEMHRARRLSYRAFDPNEVIRARIERAMSESFLNEYKLHNDIGKVIDDIDASIAQAETDEEKRILMRVRRKFELIGRFDELDINHEMPVTIRGGDKK
jgi:hypothetical protein